VFVLGLAEGLEPTLQGLAVSFAGPHSTGRLFTLIETLDMAATLVSGPIMGGIFAASQHIGTPWDGLVYAIAAVRIQSTSTRLKLFTNRVGAICLYVR
jgi:hypothetical protein